MTQADPAATTHSLTELPQGSTLRAVTAVLILVNILSRLNGKEPADSRAFAGIAYRVTADGSRFEAVYLRPSNGQKTNP